MPFPNKEQTWKPGESGNPAGKPKGAKHLSTWIQELMNDESFTAKIKEGKKFVEFKGAPMKAIITVQMKKALAGDDKAFDLLSKYGFGTKLDMTTNGKDLPAPILGGVSIQDAVPRDDSTS